MNLLIGDIVRDILIAPNLRLLRAGISARQIKYLARARCFLTITCSGLLFAPHSLIELIKSPYDIALIASVVVVYIALIDLVIR